jgi:hypothetical protein
MPAVNATVTEFNYETGFGVIRLDASGEVIAFAQHEVEIPGDREKKERVGRGTPVGNGWAPNIGTAVLYDHNHASRPITIV